MKLSEELLWRGFSAETTIKDPSTLDTRENKQFYWGADPSADSLTIGNLAALMMCATFVRHGYKPYLLVGGATGQIGDPKENGERELKSLDEVEHNKSCLKEQIERVIANATEAAESSSSDTLEGARPSLRSSEEDSSSSSTITMVDNLDWFKDMNYLSFLREVGKSFSMTQLLDRQFVQNRIGEGGSGISYAEFSYTLIQGYDFLHLYRQYDIDLQLCGADQYGNCTSGIHMIKRLENATADVWSTPLVIDPVTGRKFGKSEGNAVWLAGKDNGSGNFTSVFDFYQFWLNQPDAAVEYLIKIYTLLDKPEIEDILAKHAEAPEKRLAQRALALGATAVVHGARNAKAAENLTNLLFSRDTDFSALTAEDFDSFAEFLPTAKKGNNIVDVLVETGLCPSKTDAKKSLAGNAISVNGTKVSDETVTLSDTCLIKKGKNKLAIVK